MNKAKVIAWQRFLTVEGFYKGSIDGDFGPLTQQATITWAEKNGKLVMPVEPPAPVAPVVPTGKLMDPRSEEIIKDLDPAVQQMFRDEGLAINTLIAPFVWKWTSGRRWRAEQAKLYQTYLNGGPKAAPPGGSFHETGFAADGTVFKPDGVTPVWDGPQYDQAVAYIKSNAQLHDHSGHAYGDDPHVMIWPPSLEDGRSETAVLRELIRRIDAGEPTWP